MEYEPIDSHITVGGEKISFTATCSKRDVVSIVNKPIKNTKLKLNIHDKSYCDGYKLINYYCSRYHLGFIPHTCGSVGQYYPSKQGENMRPFVVSAVPTDEKSLLTFLHELGHHLSIQPFCAVQCEVNAWEDAFKRFRKLGYRLTIEGYKFAAKAIMSYISFYNKNKERQMVEYQLWRKRCKLEAFQPSWFYLPTSKNKNMNVVPIWKNQHNKWQKKQRYA